MTAEAADRLGVGLSSASISAEKKIGIVSSSEISIERGGVHRATTALANVPFGSIAGPDEPVSQQNQCQQRPKIRRESEERDKPAP